MVEETLFEAEERRTRAEIADTLRTVADRLEGGEGLSLTSGGDSLTVSPPDQLTFEVKAEREQEDGEEELSVEFELEWTEGGGDGGGELSIE